MKSHIEHTFELDENDEFLVTAHSETGSVSLHAWGDMDGADGYRFLLKPCTRHIDALREALRYLEALRRRDKLDQLARTPSEEFGPDASGWEKGRIGPYQVSSEKRG